MDQVSQLAKTILYENNYKKRVQKILEFVQNYINKEILKMEYLFENGNEKNQGKYDTWYIVHFPDSYRDLDFLYPDPSRFIINPP
jgi:hypothetical protein